LANREGDFITEALRAKVQECKEFRGCRGQKACEIIAPYAPEP
jgi:hypothetical protein